MLRAALSFVYSVSVVRRFVQPSRGSAGRRRLSLCVLGHLRGLRPRPPISSAFAPASLSPRKSSLRTRAPQSSYRRGQLIADQSFAFY